MFKTYRDFYTALLLVEEKLIIEYPKWEEYLELAYEKVLSKTINRDVLNFKPLAKMSVGFISILNDVPSDNYDELDLYVPKV